MVSRYLDDAGLTGYLEALGFHLVGYGCTTCIGNSGPLPDAVAKSVTDGKLTVAAVLSGNRNFEGRVNPLVKANYLASPPLVVAYAIAGRVDIDLQNEPIGTGKGGDVIYLRDIWPTNSEVQQAVAASVRQEMFEKEYSVAFEGDPQWRAIKTTSGDLFNWDENSTYIRRPPYFDEMVDPATSVGDLKALRALATLGDSITTDHISPAGNIAKDSAAAKYLTGNAVAPQDFNQYGARRGNHEVMVRGTLANIRLKNQLAGGVEGGWTKHQPSGELMTIYDASVNYKQEGVGLLILAGKEYGSGSSRDWAAKGVQLLGVKAAIAESFERIHRSNLVGMGVLPMQFQSGESKESLGLDGTEQYFIEGVAEGIAHTKRATVRAVATDGSEKKFTVVIRIDTPTEAEYYRSGGILPYVLRQLAASSVPAKA